MKVREAELLQARELAAAALAEIEAALEKKDYRTAESLLYGAETRFGEREELSPFYERIAGQRSQELEEKKRQEEIAGRIAAARELAGREDFQGALEELSRAASLPTMLRRVPCGWRSRRRSLQEDRETQKRLEEMRREEAADGGGGRRAPRVQALLDRGPRRSPRRSGSDQALAALRQAADLAPDHSVVRNLTQRYRPPCAGERRRSADRRADERRRRPGESISTAANSPRPPAAGKDRCRPWRPWSPSRVADPSADLASPDDREARRAGESRGRLRAAGGGSPPRRSTLAPPRAASPRS